MKEEVKLSWKELVEKNAEWLLESTPYTRYRTQVDLLGLAENDLEVQRTKGELLNFQPVVDLIGETHQWFKKTSTRHDDATLSHYKLRVLADFGITVNEPLVAELLPIIKKNRRNDMFSISQNLPKQNPVVNETWHALPCDSPLISYVLLKMGDTSFEVQQTVEQLKRYWISTEGWFCNLMFVNNQFKKHRISCPMGGLMALEVFSMIESLKSSGLAKNAFKTLDFHREYGKSLYYFGRSKRFWSFKYPFVWYNAFYLGEVLTNFAMFKDEPTLKEIIAWISAGFDSNGRITANSMFRAYSDWEFSNKKAPSPWLTFLAIRMLKRYDEL